jgi:hypothetical protein
VKDTRETKPCLLSCNVLKDEIEKLIEERVLNVNTFYLDMSLHADYHRLQKALIQAIEANLSRFSQGIALVYGDLCLGHDDQMKELLNRYGLVKVDALNCIDCLLGGGGKFLEMDPKQECLFMSPGWIRYFVRFKKLAQAEENKDAFESMFSGLKGIILLDSLGNLAKYKKEIEELRNITGLPILERKDIGLENLKRTVLKATERLYTA